MTEEWKGEACKICNIECEGVTDLPFAERDWYMCKVKGFIWVKEKEKKEVEDARRLGLSEMRYSKCSVEG